MTYHCLTCGEPCDASPSACCGALAKRDDAPAQRYDTKPTTRRTVIDGVSSAVEPESKWWEIGRGLLDNAFLEARDYAMIRAMHATNARRWAVPLAAEKEPIDLNLVRSGFVASADAPEAELRRRLCMPDDGPADRAPTLGGVGIDFGIRPTSVSYTATDADGRARRLRDVGAQRKPCSDCGGLDDVGVDFDWLKIQCAPCWATAHGISIATKENHVSRKSIETCASCGVAAECDCLGDMNLGRALGFDARAGEMSPRCCQSCIATAKRLADRPAPAASTMRKCDGCGEMRNGLPEGMHCGACLYARHESTFNRAASRGGAPTGPTLMDAAVRSGLGSVVNTLAREDGTTGRSIPAWPTARIDARNATIAAYREAAAASFGVTPEQAKARAELRRRRREEKRARATLGECPVHVGDWREYGSDGGRVEVVGTYVDRGAWMCWTRYAGPDGSTTQQNGSVVRLLDITTPCLPPPVRPPQNSRGVGPDIVPWPESIDE